MDAPVAIDTHTLAWRGRTRRIVAAAMTPCEGRALGVAMSHVGAEGVVGAVAAFDVAAWVASGLVPRPAPPVEEMH